LLKASGITATDIKDNMVKIGETLTSIKGAASTGWDWLKTGIGYIKNLFNKIVNLPHNIATSTTEIFSKLPVIGKYFNPSTATPTDGRPDYLNDTGTTEVSNAETASVLAGGVAAYKFRKPIIGAGKLVKNAITGSTSLAKRVIKGKTSNAVEEVVAKTASTVEASKPKSVANIRDRLSSRGGRATKVVNIAEHASFVPKATPKLPKGNVTIANKLKAMLSVLKKKAVTKLGTKGAAILLGKLAARAIPIVGWALLLSDAVTVVYYLAKGYSFESSASKAILGVDLFEGEDIGSPTKTSSDALSATKPISNVVSMDKHRERAVAAISGANVTYSSAIPLDSNMSKPDYIQNLEGYKKRKQDAKRAAIPAVVEPKAPVVNVTSSPVFDKEGNLDKIAVLTEQSVSIQSKMLDTLVDISTKLSTEHPTDNLDQQLAHIPRAADALPAQTVDIKRRVNFK